MGRRRDGRHIMFACRLTEKENEYLESLLEVADSYEECKSDQFRSIIKELSGRLSRNLFGHLVYEAPESEVFTKEEQKELEFQFRHLR